MKKELGIVVRLTLLASILYGCATGEVNGAAPTATDIPIARNTLVVDPPAPPVEQQPLQQAAPIKPPEQSNAPAYAEATLAAPGGPLDARLVARIEAGEFTTQEDQLKSWLKYWCNTNPPLTACEVSPFYLTDASALNVLVGFDDGNTIGFPPMTRNGLAYDGAPVPGSATEENFDPFRISKLMDRAGALANGYTEQEAAKMDGSIAQLKDGQIVRVIGEKVVATIDPETRRYVMVESDFEKQMKADFAQYGFNIPDGATIGESTIYSKEGKLIYENVDGVGRFDLRYAVNTIDPSTLKLSDLGTMNGDLKNPTSAAEMETTARFRAQLTAVKSVISCKANETYVGMAISINQFNGKDSFGILFSCYNTKTKTTGDQYLFYETTNQEAKIIPIIQITDENALFIHREEK